MRNDSDVARILQQGLAPRAVPEVAGLSVAARYRVGGLGEVGGDWYDVLDLPGAGVAVVIGDAAGHGVSAATTMAHLRHGLHAYVLENNSPATVLRRLNHLAQWMLPGEVATVLVAVVDPHGERITVASAGHLPPLLLGGAAPDYLVMDPGPAVGVVTDPSYAETERPLDTGLLFFTDGLIERRGKSIDDGLSRLATASSTPLLGDELLDHLLAAVPDPAGSDDLAVVAVRRADA